MSRTSSQDFLGELNKKLWSAADKLRSNLGPEIIVKNGKTTPSKFTSTGKLIDNALETVEKENPKHGGSIGDILVFGQESNPTTWRLAAMNMGIRGIDFDFGKEPADTFTRDQHPDLAISKAELRMWN